MRKFTYLLVLMLLVSCTNTKKSGETLLENVEVESEVYNPHSFLITSSKLPDTVDLNTDFSEMTYQELRLLKSYVYATKGVWFLDGELNSFFQNKCDWYYGRCYKYLESHDWNALTDTEKVRLTDKERAFVDKISKRMVEMEKNRYVDREGLKLLNPALTVNMFVMNDFDQPFFDKLSQFNFAVAPTANQQLFNIYEENDYHCIPNYMTTDVYLQAFHMYFSYVLKMVEKHEFASRIHRVCQQMNERANLWATTAPNAELKDMAEYNAAFFAIADHLLMGNSELLIPESYRETVATELRNISRLEATPSPMMSYREQNFAYDLFKPRGHYTRSEEQQRYFRAMMWLQTCTFCREKQASVKYASMMAYLISSFAVEEKAMGRDVYETLNFLMGEPDNVSVYDIADYMQEHRYASVSDLTDENKLKALDKYLKTLFEKRNRITSKIVEVGCEDKINFMPQRYSPDAEILSRMFDETPNANHPFPSGLNVFSAFGAKEADNIINNVYDYPSQWKDYKKEAAAMKERFMGYDDWDNAMYNKWMECLVQLQNEDKNHPDYMQTSAWKRKNLNTALASWTTLKHDAILYGEQPLVAECGGGGEFPDPILVGYVEPNMKFWNKMKELLVLTRNLLQKHQLMNPNLDERTNQLEDYIDFCIVISKKELARKPLSVTEYAGIRYLGSSLEWFTLSVIEPDLILDSWEKVQGPDRSVALVSDVFTRNVIGCEKCGILYEAIGNADAIYVTVEIGDKVYLTRGATFSYYEFVHPLGERLTDEEWQDRLEKGKVPGRPTWMLPLIIDKEPEANEEIFYSTGC